MTRPTVVLGYNQDRATRASLIAAIDAAKFRGATLRIIHQLAGTEAIDVFGKEVSRDDHITWTKTRIEREARALGATDPLEIVITQQGAVRELMRASAHSELLILGATSAHPWASATFETVPYQLARKSRCPILLVPAGVQIAANAPLVCGVDRSLGSINALRWSLQEGHRRHCDVYAIEVHRGHQPDVASPALWDWMHRVMPAATPFACLEATGHPADVLVEHAADRQAIVVTGSHPQAGPVGRHSVARALAAQTRVPSVIVPLAAVPDQSEIDELIARGGVTR